jgi:zinc protease
VEVLLSSGLTVFHLPMPFPPCHCLGMVFPRGTFADPPGREGLHSLLAHQLLRAADGLSPERLQEAWDRLGAVAETAAESEYTALTLEVLEDRLPEALELLARCLDGAVFPSAETVLAKRGMKGGLRMSLTDPDFVTEVHAFALAYGEEHPLARPATVRTLSRLGPRELRDAHGRLLRSGRRACFIASPWPAGRILPLLSRAFSTWRVPSPPEDPWPAMPPVERPRIRIIPRRTMSQVCLHALLPAPPRPDPRYLPLKLAAYGLAEGGFSARLMARLRVELSSTYGISGSYRGLRDFGYLQFATMVDGALAPKALGIIRSEYARWRAEGPTPDELEEAREYSLRALPLLTDSPADLGALLLRNHLHGLPSDYLERYLERLRTVTLDEVKAAVASLPPVIPFWAASGERRALRACFAGLDGVEERGWEEF